MSDTSGRTSPEPLAHYDPATSCWRMSGGMFPSASMPSLPTLPDWGTTRAGALYALPTPALPTDEPESSSSLPTPRATRGGSGTETMYALGAERSDDGRTQGEVLLPTPVVNDMGAGKTPEAWDAWTERMKGAHGNGNGHGPSLSIEALRLLPTPTARDWKDGARCDAVEENALLGRVVWRFDGTLLPTPTAADAAGSRNSTHPRPPGSKANIGDTLTDAATVLTGARTRARSGDGNASPDDQPLDLLSLLTEAPENDSAPASSNG